MKCNFALFIIIWTMIMCVQGLHIYIVSCNLSNPTKINRHTITLEPVTKHLVAKDIDRFYLSMDE